MVMAFGSVGIADTAQANNIDIKARGTWQFAFGVVSNMSMRKSFNDSSEWRVPNTTDATDRGRDLDKFEALQRVRTQINFISSEHLQAVLQFEIGIMNWGRGTTEVAGNQAGGNLDSRGINIKTRRAYLDWIIPHTQVSVRMGIQGLALPSGRMGNPVFDDNVAGIVIASPITDNFGLTAFWLRPFADNRYIERADAPFNKLTANTDVFGLVAPITFSGVSFSPYVMYATIGAAGAGNNDDIDMWRGGRWRAGNGSDGYFGTTYGFGDSSLGSRNRATDAWWLGFNLNVDILDPLVFSLDAIYGGIGKVRHSAFDEITGSGLHVSDRNAQFSASGWYIGTTLDYKLDWGTPGIFGWYSSGDKSNAFGTVHTDDGEVTCAQRVRSGRLPVLGTNGGFLPTSFGFPGYYGIGNGGGLNEAVISHTGTGTWGIGIQLADVSFIQDLSHTLRFAYYQGTNSAGHYTWGDGYVGRGGNVRSTLKYNVDPMYLTTKDSVFEVNFDHVYKIYENLEVALELGWLRLSSDRRTWGSVPGDGLRKNDDAFKAGLNFTYSF